MAQSLDEQISIVERALGECMIDTALVVVRAWLLELGENNPYEEAFTSIQAHYHDFFNRWLNTNDPKAAEELNTLTGDTYQLVDAVYAAIRLRRGLSPDMHGFNPESPQSVMNYFANSVRLRPEDLDWLHDTLNAPSNISIALMAVNSVTRALRDCFNVETFLALIEGIQSESEVVSDQCLANAFMLTIHYDIRMDFFPQIQDALANAVADMDDGGEHAFDVLCALVRAVPAVGNEQEEQEAFNQLPEAIREFLEKLGVKDEMRSLMAWVPKSEQEYMSGIIQIFPQTWLYEVLVEGEPERENILTQTYLRSGNRDLMWQHPDMAESYLVQTLRKGSDKPMDYINLAHCQMLKGDRMMAFENYKQARQLCKSSKEFFGLFRPDRRQLVDCGVPVEQIYLIEDKLI